MTFISLETGGQFKRFRFIEDDDDRSRADIFRSTELYWRPIEDRVEAWVKSGWAKWEEERPEFFTDQWKDMVPREFIPERATKSMAKNEELQAAVIKSPPRKSRRKSVIELVMGMESRKIAPMDYE